MHDAGTGLSTREAALIVAVIECGGNVHLAAERAHLSERTAHRWLATEHVRNAYRAAVRDCASATLDALRVGARLAVETLTGVMLDPDASAVDRRHAAGLLLHAFSRIAPEVLDVEDRLRALEDRRSLTVA
jgi:hypothetical protein